MSSIELIGITKHFGTVCAVDNMNLSIPQGSLCSLLGPSGCGKTTTLRLLAGFETPDRGTILLDGQDISALPPEKRPLAMVFQNYALWPHLTLFGNVAYGLRLKGFRGRELAARVDTALNQVGLAGYQNRYPRQLSGGEQQRVALARGLAQEPKLLLMDEPLSNLDASLRDAMRELIRSLHEASGITMVFVTHDQEEALSLSDLVVVMDQGVIQQTDSPQAIFGHPDNHFVATFMGKTNSFPAEPTADTNDSVSLGPDIRMRIPIGFHLDSGQPARLCIRSEQILILNAETDRDMIAFGNSAQGKFLFSYYFGTFLRTSWRLGGQPVWVDLDAADERDFSSGSWFLHFPLAQIMIFANEPTHAR